MSKKAPELTFQQHIADFFVREHKYGVLEQTDITYTEHFIAEDQLWAFLTATDPSREQNFRWHNTGLTNTPQPEH